MLVKSLLEKIPLMFRNQRDIKRVFPKQVTLYVQATY